MTELDFNEKMVIASKRFEELKRYVDSINFEREHVIAYIKEVKNNRFGSTKSLTSEWLKKCESFESKMKSFKQIQKDIDSDIMYFIADLKCYEVGEETK